MKVPAIVTMLLWITPLLLQALIAVVMIIRNQVRTFPVFFTYTIFVSLRDLILLFIRGNLDVYSLVYLIGEAISVSLGMAIIYEVFWQLIRPYRYLRLIGRRVVWISIVLFCIAGFALLMASQGKEASRSIQIVWLAERSARFVQVGVLVVFIASISHFGLTWRHYAAGIVAGFGVAAGLQLGIYELKSNLHGLSDEMFTLMAPAAYNCAVIIWALYFLFPHRENRSEPLPAVDLSKLDRMLAEFIGK
jgi:hypothetical protein